MVDSSQFELLATCPDEIKEVVVNEVTALGAKDIKPLYKAVRFWVDEEGFYKAHLWLATVSNLYLIVKEAKAFHIPMIFSQAKRVDWTHYFRSNKSFRVDASIADRGTHEITANLLSKTVKEAILHVFSVKEDKLPTINVAAPDVIVMVHLHNGILTLGLHTSGKAMHKRGYRSVEGHPAPLKETMAAALLRMVGYDGSQVLFDPMCGSGTIAIEAAYLALHKAPLIHRRKGEFSFEYLGVFKRSVWEEIQDNARQSKLEELPAAIYASDLNAGYIEFAKATALRARVERYIDFSCQDFLHALPPAPNGIMICNLPYGERLKKGEREDLTNFYQKIGDHLKKNYHGWTVALLVAESSPYQSLGLRPKKKIPILNGSLKAKLLIFQIFAGTWQSHRTQEASDS